MITTTVRRRDAGLLTVAALLTVAVVLAAAYFLVPPLLGPDRLDGFPGAFAAYWSSGSTDFPPGLQHLVDHQSRYHLVRTVIALPLLAVLVILAVRLRRFRLLIGAFALATAVLLIESVQGFVSPFGTLLPNLASGPTKPDPAFLAQVRDQLANGPMSPALHVMLDEYVRWHVAKAVLTAVLAAVLIGLSVAAWRRRRWFSLVLTAVSALAALVWVAANVSTVADPDSGFLLLLEGSW